MGQYRHKGLSADQRAVMHAQHRERELALERALAASSTSRRHFGKVLEVLCGDPAAELARAQARDVIVQGCFQQMDTGSARVTYRDLLNHLDAEGCDNLLEHTSYLQGVAQLAMKARHFVRPFDSWTRPGRNMHRQFSSLLRHCLALYDVPSLLDQAWCEPDRHDARRWFIDVGAGYNIRNSKGLPITMNKRIAHHFLNAPPDLDIDGALRWAQVVGQFGDPRLARMVIASRLGRNGFVREDYWSGVVRFFIQHPFMDANKVHEVVDFLTNRLEAGEPVDMTGRTATSLARLSDGWHRDLHRASGKIVDRNWQRSSIMDARYETGKKHERIVWKVTELLGVQELVTEGRAMQHCVATYAASCSRRVSAIFSITAEDIIGNVERGGTIEVNLKTARVVQAKAKRNTPIKPASRAVLEKWARREGLGINEQL